MRLLIGIFMLLAGCTNADISQVTALGGSQHIELYSASGNIISYWNSSGVVRTEKSSDGWYFTDAKSGELVRISGTVIIKQNKDDAERESRDSWSDFVIAHQH